MIKKLALAILFLSPAIHAQSPPWTGILDSTRAMDWTSDPAVTFTIPSGSWSQCVTSACNTLAAAGTGATATQINSAITSAAQNSYVLLGPGTYSLNGCINWSGHSYTVLRGSGPSSTIIKYTGGSCSGLSGTAQVMLAPSANTYDASPNNSTGGSNNLVITGTTEGGAGVYPQGATHLTVSNVGSDTPKVGTMLILAQQDEQAPHTGWLTCQATTSGAACSENGNGSAGISINGVKAEQMQEVIITSCNGSGVKGASCGTGTTYTISPGIYPSNFRASQNPAAWWNTSSQLCTQCGIENLTMDFYAGTTYPSGFNIYNCYECWITGSRLVSGGGRNDIYLVQSDVVILRNDYFFATKGNSSGGGYVVDNVETCDVLIENNIFDQVDNPYIGENGCAVIFGYNYSHNNIFTNAQWVIDTIPSHDAGSFYGLWEGNNIAQVSEDNQHGPSPAFTFFRNVIQGNQPMPIPKSEFTTPVEFQSYSAGMNFIGNILGIGVCVGGSSNGQPADKLSQCPGASSVGGSYQAAYQTYPPSTTASCPNVIYMLGWPTGGCSSSAGNLLADAGVHDSMMRWGNWDSVSQTVRWDTTEASPAASPYFNANFSSAYFSTLPHTIPASLYYTSKPSWWHSAYGNPPFPLNGPDVTGGNIDGVAGHANENIARLCWENSSLDTTNYPSTAIIRFDSSVCYPSAAGSVSIAPSSENFGSVTVGVTSPGQTSTVTNTSGSTITISTINYTGANALDFATSSTTCSGTVANGSGCTITTTFKPSISGTESATLNFSFTGASGSPAVVSLSGIGGAPQIGACVETQTTTPNISAHVGRAVTETETNSTNANVGAVKPGAVCHAIQ